MATLGCEVEEYGEAEQAFEAAPTPAPGVPAVVFTPPPLQAGPTRWVSRWDNPPMTGSYQQQGLERTESDIDIAWSHDTFDLMTRQSSPAYDIFAIPLSGNYTRGTVVPWVAHGMSLPPRVTLDVNEGIVDFHLRYNSSSPGTFVPYSAVAKVQLDPNVILVPIHVVQLYVAGQSGDENGWYSESQAEVTFDDYWLAADNILNAAPFYPYQVTHTWLHKPNSATVMQHAQPDPIWSQCDIQFRMVAYTACAVDRAVFDNDTACGSPGSCGTQFSHPHASAVINAVNACAAAQNKPGKPVIMTGSLDAEDCPGECFSPTIGITDPPTLSIVTQQALALAGGGTIAHELGHLLGVDGHSSNQDDLMYDKHQSGSPHLLGSSECAKARTQAAIFQDQVW